MVQQMKINVICHINRTRDRNHMIISIGAEKASVKTQHLFMTETLNKLVIEENYPNVIKATCERLTASIKLNSERWKVFPLRLRK